MVTVLPTELSVVATLSVTVRWAISMTKRQADGEPEDEHDRDRPRGIAKGVAEPLDREFTCYSSGGGGGGGGGKKKKKRWMRAGARHQHCYGVGYVML